MGFGMGSENASHRPGVPRSSTTVAPGYTPVTVAWNVVTPVMGSLVAALCIFLVLARFDDAVQRSAWIDASGQARGQIDDRFGNPLAWSVPSGTGAVRKYAGMDLGPLVGFRDAGGHWHGLESEYSALLDPPTDSFGLANLRTRLSARAIRGDTVTLTIDSHVQRAAMKALGRGRGAVVALDPRNGDVLAMVSKPACDPNAMTRAAAFHACEGAPTGPLVDRATSRLFAPGSIFKIVTLDAALNTGRFHLTDLFSGADAFGPSPYFDNSLYPSNVTRSDLHVLTLSQALAFSDNFTFAHIGLTLGAPTLLTYAHRFYIGRQIPFDLPVSISQIADASKHPSLSVLAQSAFGAGVDRVTPLQMAMVVSAVANGGNLMAPHLLERIDGSSGVAVKKYTPRLLGRVVSTSTAKQVASAMSFVVNHGSGFNAAIPGIQVAGKTGTAVSGGNLPNAWFICFAPASHPVVAVAVLNQFTGEGFQFAAPIARAVLLAALKERGIHPK